MEFLGCCQSKWVCIKKVCAVKFNISRKVCVALKGCVSQHTSLAAENYNIQLTTPVLNKNKWRKKCRFW